MTLDCGEAGIDESEAEAALVMGNWIKLNPYESVYLAAK